MNRTLFCVACVAVATSACSQRYSPSLGNSPTTTTGTSTGAGGDSSTSTGVGGDNGGTDMTTTTSTTGTGGGGSGVGGDAGAGGSDVGGSGGTGGAGGAGGSGGSGTGMIDPKLVVPDLDGFYWEGTCNGASTEAGRDCKILDDNMQCPNTTSGTPFSMRGAFR